MTALSTTGIAAPAPTFGSTIRNGLTTFVGYGLEVNLPLAYQFALSLLPGLENVTSEPGVVPEDWWRHSLTRPNPAPAMPKNPKPDLLYLQRVNDGSREVIHRKGHSLLRAETPPSVDTLVLPGGIFADGYKICTEWNDGSCELFGAYYRQNNPDGSLQSEFTLLPISPECCRIFLAFPEGTNVDWNGLLQFDGRPAVLRGPNRTVIRLNLHKVREYAYRSEQLGFFYRGTRLELLFRGYLK